MTISKVFCSAARACRMPPQRRHSSPPSGCRVRCSRASLILLPFSRPQDFDKRLKQQSRDETRDFDKWQKQQSRDKTRG